MTTWMHQTLKPGDIVNISKAKGEFIVDDINQPMLFIAAGSGITPFISMINQALALNIGCDIQLMYYANNNNHLFVKELKNQVKHHPNFTLSLIDSTHSGRICLQHLQQYCSDFVNRQCYICGPVAMIEKTKKLLVSNNISATNIHFELFGAAPIDSIAIDTAGITHFDQSAIKVESQPAQTLLQIAENSGLKPITGCRIGICHQCICQKQKGVVFNTLTKLYSDTGNEEVQLCISVPVGDVTISL
jgi:ferredoxin-NADP reductase